MGGPYFYENILSSHLHPSRMHLPYLPSRKLRDIHLQEHIY